MSWPVHLLTGLIAVEDAEASAAPKQVIIIDHGLTLDIVNRHRIRMTEEGTYMRAMAMLRASLLLI